MSRGEASTLSLACLPYFGAQRIVVDILLDVVHFNNIRIPSQLKVKKFDMREKDRKKFVRLASKRVSRALNSIRLIGNLSNRSNYDYTDEDVQKMLKALQEELNACRKRFELATKKSGKAVFALE